MRGAAHQLLAVRAVAHSLQRKQSTWKILPCAWLGLGLRLRLGLGLGCGWGRS